MNTDFRIFRDDLDIFTHYKQTYFFCSHLYFLIKNEMFILRIKCHQGGTMTSQSVHKQNQRIPPRHRTYTDIYDFGYMILDFVKIFINTFHFSVLRSLRHKCSRLNCIAYKMRTDAILFWNWDLVLNINTIFYFADSVYIVERMQK